MKRIREKNINTQEHFNEVFNENANLYDSYKNIEIYNKLLKLELFSGASFLDFGCGNAAGLYKTLKTHSTTDVYGVDISNVIIDANREQYPSIHFLTTNEFDTKKPTADTIISTHTLEHTEDPKAVVKKLLSISNKKMFVIVPYKTSWNKCAEHLWEFDKKSFDNLSPTYALPGIINEAGYQEILYFWDKNQRRSKLSLLSFYIKINRHHSFKGVFKKLIRYNK